MKFLVSNANKAKTSCLKKNSINNSLKTTLVLIYKRGLKA